ncbi:hypothetical protein [Croceicoccus gelatinilyticus]|uniref:hypothetical protein n=1 Tax=Croceicoccus gelatinilyticus TaxID=2835536 RepID=UPI001BD0446C|nr:hypothetical protein [Croceicoccus gelatinilyticus]MBS7668702.1 hypothetical protein [Croceicoccus gelatinilyticus]
MQFGLHPEGHLVAKERDGARKEDGEHHPTKEKAGPSVKPGVALANSPLHGWPPALPRPNPIASKTAAPPTINSQAIRTFRMEKAMMAANPNKAKPVISPSETAVRPPSGHSRVIAIKAALASR